MTTLKEKELINDLYKAHSRIELAVKAKDYETAWNVQAALDHLMLNAYETAFNRLKAADRVPKRIDYGIDGKTYVMSMSNGSEYNTKNKDIVKELKKIQDEIDDLEWYGDDAFWDGVNAVNRIITKHIKEVE